MAPPEPVQRSNRGTSPAVRPVSGAHRLAPQSGGTDFSTRLRPLVEMLSGSPSSDPKRRRRAARRVRPAKTAPTTAGDRSPLDADGRQRERRDVGRRPQPLDRPGGVGVGAGRRSGSAVLYLHGGAYVIGSINTLDASPGASRERRRRAVLNVDYRLAPGARAPGGGRRRGRGVSLAPRPGPGPARIAVAGDSAGGGLTIATLLAIRDAGCRCRPRASRVSPWVDLEGIGESMTSAAHLDPMVQKEHLVRMGGLSGRQGPRRPLAAPLSQISPGCRRSSSRSVPRRRCSTTRRASPSAHARPG